MSQVIVIRVYFGKCCHIVAASTENNQEAEDGDLSEKDTAMKNGQKSRAVYSRVSVRPCLPVVTVLQIMTIQLEPVADLAKFSKAITRRSEVSIAWNTCTY